jgi:hypothetical protein
MDEHGNIDSERMRGLVKLNADLLRENQQLRQQLREATHSLFLRDVLDERTRQDAQWGGAAHDDEHTAFDWVALLTKHVGRAVVDNPTTFRGQMVKVAGLAWAAGLWVDRDGQS